MIYINRPLRKKSFLQTIFRQEPEENAVIELNNSLASRELKSITRENIRAIEDKYKVSLKKDFQLNLEEFYLVYLNECLREAFTLTESQQNDLAHFKKLLSFNDTEIKDLHQRLATSIYGITFEKRLRDHRHSAGIEAKLTLLVQALGMVDAALTKIRQDKLLMVVNELIAKVTNKNRFSVEDENELNALAVAAGIPIKIDEKTDQKLKKARKLWELENLDLTVVQVNSALQKNEVCYFHAAKVDRYEYRSERGVRVLRLLYTGNMLLTNKRLIFESREKNTAIKLSVVTGAHLYENCLEIRKETGRSPLLALPELEELSIVIKRLL